MIDVHCHILPAIDDGSKSMEISIEMARIAVNEGIHTIVATPHHLNGVYSNNRQKILSAVSEFQKKLDEEKIPLKILPGSDVHVAIDLKQRILSKDVMTINQGDVFLLEWPHQLVPPDYKEFLYDLMLDGLLPVITHPERNLGIQRNPKLLLEMVNQGALCQVTAMSITGDFGGAAQKTVEFFLKEGVVDLIATDAHAVSWRPPKVKAALQAAAKIVGESAVSEMIEGKPARIVAGEL